MFDIDDLYQLNYSLSSGKKIIFSDKILQKINDKDLSEFPEKTSLFLEGFEYFILNFNDKEKLKIFRFPIKCKFKDLKEEIKIISDVHFKLILQKKLNEKIYTNPYYYSKYSKKNININIDDIEKAQIFLDKYIEIKDKIKINNSSSINSIFDQCKSLYEIVNIDKYSYEFISLNFNSYFPNLKIILKDEFFIIYTQNRAELGNRLANFLDKKESSSLYPICGPHGTGKTISALIIHKLLFRNGIRGLYLNLKYYSNEEIKLENKKEVLIKECFFICDNEQELLSLYDLIITKQNLHDLFYLISEFIKKKNKKNDENNNKNAIKENSEKKSINIQVEKKENNNNNDNKIYIIIDQYQEVYNMNYLLNMFQDNKIFLLSSINDFDVKDNLIIKYEEVFQDEYNWIKDRKKNIKYNYIDNLIDDYYNRKDFQELIKKK